MLKWNESLYLGKMVEAYEDSIRSRLDQDKVDVGHYLITISENQHDQLDIVSTTLIQTKAQRLRLPLIVGIAGTRQEAFRLVKTITEDCLRERGDACLRDFLMKKTMI